MSKNSRQRKKIAKRARKAANRAAFEERIRTNRNSKSARSRAKSRADARKKKLISHPEGPCGNIGCKRCDPCHIHHK